MRNKTPQFTASRREGAISYFLLSGSYNSYSHFARNLILIFWETENSLINYVNGNNEVMIMKESTIDFVGVCVCVYVLVSDIIKYSLLVISFSLSWCFKTANAA